MATRPDRHDLAFTDLWPLLLVLALLLWPLDIALRRMSLGRREFAAAGGWVRAIPRRRGATAARTAAGEGLLAARDRATSAGARAAMRRPDEQAPVAAPSVAAGPVAAAPSVPVIRTSAERAAVTGALAQAASPATPAAPAAAPAAPTPPAPAPAPAPAAKDGAETMARLRDAKRRARER